MSRAHRDPNTGLTDQQIAFVHAFIETGNATEAYRRAYRSEKMGYGTIKVEASRLLNSPNISLTIADLRKKAIGAAFTSLLEYLAELDRLKRRAEDAGDYRSAVKAEELRGKVMKYYTERREIGSPREFDNLSDDELDRELAAYRKVGGRITKARQLETPSRKRRSAGCEIARKTP